jgi:predicted Rossmann fold nucleotide-binding protein DprA/Smf involved in DNA uptake
MSEPTIYKIPPDDQKYPASLKLFLHDKAPSVITAIGNIDILQTKTIALLCSMKCPGNIILKTYDRMKEIRDAGITVISGFHSPMERECLNILLKGKQPIVICPAKALDGSRISAELCKPLADGRLLMLSPFDEKHNRISADRAEYRNRFIAALPDEILIPYAAPGSKTELLLRDIMPWGKTIRQLQHNGSPTLPPV